MSRRKDETSMVVGFGTIVLRLPENHDLKGKRKVVKSVIGRICSHFNVSAAEVGANDILQKAVIGVALVTNDHALADSKLDMIVNFVEEMMIAEIIDTDMEVMTL